MTTPRQARYADGFEVPNFSVASLSLGLEEKENLDYFDRFHPDTSRHTPKDTKNRVVKDINKNERPLATRDSNKKDTVKNLIETPNRPTSIQKEVDTEPRPRKEKKPSQGEPTPTIIPPVTPVKKNESKPQQPVTPCMTTATPMPNLPREQKKRFNMLILEARDLEEKGAFIEAVDRYKEAASIFASDKLVQKIQQYEDDLEQVPNLDFVYHKSTERYLLKGGLGIPKKIFQTLFDYQRDGLRWLWAVHQNEETPGGILAVCIRYRWHIQSMPTLYHCRMTWGLARPFKRPRSCRPSSIRSWLRTS